VNSDQIFFGVLVIMGTGSLAMIVVFPLWIILHNKLSKLDSILLREPFFKKSEQINCLVWPLSYLKTVNYIGLIAAPRYAKRVRFRGFNDPLPVDKRTVIACKVQFWLMVFCGFMGVVYFAYGAFFLYIFPRL
jgi:hypothetical protein